MNCKKLLLFRNIVVRSLCSRCSKHHLSSNVTPIHPCKCLLIIVKIPSAVQSWFTLPILYQVCNSLELFTDRLDNEPRAFHICSNTFSWPFPISGLGNTANLSVHVTPGQVKASNRIPVENATLFYDSPALLQHLLTDTIDHNVKLSLPILCNPSRDIRLPVVEHFIRTQSSDHVNISCATGSDDVCAGQLRQLHRPYANTPGRRRDEYAQGPATTTSIPAAAATTQRRR